MSTAEPRVHILPEGSAAQSCSETRLGGGVKPLHRFIRGEPKSVGITMLFLGLTIVMTGFVTCRIVEKENINLQAFMIGVLFITSGILCVVCENRPTKQLVTACLAVNIVSILVSPFAVIRQMTLVYLTDMHFVHHENYTDIDNCTEDCWSEELHHSVIGTYGLLTSYILSGMVLLIVMSAFACAGLRPSQSQVVVVMNTKPTADN
ncbi:uncharacterized protein LOC131735214 [Acipenser ruthenus]|uniref:uncharacterized protein LOC131735214 n=1 Tax=Acipenser ruthenus TaxID=7906 RepID=UPI00274246F4|nr:uncharacterized protein LOC131735214 [Acipenser ruthenus]XP_058877515.1 uncharacterized protein LOC131735214 [Acipenser ruthenus]XP_058877516.1 uncharacterized protein LOC131735214 [Acipenser ruthenus]